MPLQKLQFRPGVNREGTTLANEGGWFESDKVRFRSGFPEKLGGWEQDGGTYNPRCDIGQTQIGGTTPAAVPTGNYWGVCRSMWCWNSLQGTNFASLGTNLKYYVQQGVGGQFNDITPIRRTSPTITDPFYTQSTETSENARTMLVTDPGHGAVNGDFVVISAVSAYVNGLSPTVMNREYRITYVNSNQYYITLTQDASSTGTPSVTAVFTYQINTGLDIYTVAAGWGAGTWGGAVAGTTTSTLATALAGTTLSAQISASDTTINVVSTTGFDSPSGSAWLGQELVTYSGTTGTSLTSVTRGTGGTAAAVHCVGSSVVANITTIELADVTGFGSDGTVVIGGESITYGGVDSGAHTLTTCTRGANGSSAASHAVSAIVTRVTTTAGTSQWNGWGQSASNGGVGQQLRLWSETNYGEDLIFNVRGGPMYYWAVNANPNLIDRGVEMTHGTTVNGVALDSTCPSVANIVMTSDASRFLFAFGTNDPSGVLFSATQDPLLIRWSNQEDYGTWIPSATNQAGDVRLSTGSEIIAAQQTRQEILVWTDAALYSLQYLGPPYVWGTQIMGDNISIAGPNVAATANNVTYWLGTDKFYMYSGRVETLPCTLRQYVFDDINMQQAFQFFAGTNEGYNEIWWFYCSANSNVIDKYVIFNHLERTWYYGAMQRTAWLDSPLREEPMAAGYNGQMLYHEVGNDDGTTTPASPIEAYVQSSDFDIGDGHNFGLVTRIIPDVTFDGSDVAQPTVTFTVRPRRNPGANYGSSDSPDVVSVDNYANQRTYNVQQFTQYVYVRVRGRQMAFRIGSNDLGVAWQLGAPRLDVRPDGRR